MDQVRAERMTKELTGTQVGGWTIYKFIGAGKSALVFRANRSGKQAALKVFDPELVERFGRKTQLGRIDRERSLIGKVHPNLVEIYDGGECDDSGYLFVAMQFIEARNLEEALCEFPRDKINSLIGQVASAAIYLEEQGLAHRDIKPSNIAVSDDFDKAVLLDLGVLRPFGDPDLTDEDTRVFIGTLRYSSPEFLTRTEKDTEDGWRAISIYQLGGVLHDMIMRKPLFHEFSDPYALLVEAVKSEQPQIQADDVSPDLVLLSQNCLVKSPDSRLDLVSWKDFTKPVKSRLDADAARERVTKRSLRARTQDVTPQQTAGYLNSTQLSGQIVDAIDGIIRRECAGNASFPRMEIRRHVENPTQVHVVFDSSDALLVPRRLSVCLHCRLIDDATMAVQIESSACLLADDSEHLSAPKTYDLFRGSLDSASLTFRLHECLYLSLDLAQSCNHNALPINGPLWLPLAADTNEE